MTYTCGLGGHIWNLNSDGRQACADCGVIAPAPPGFIAAGAPPVPDSTGIPGFTITELGHMRLAGRWGLLRSLNFRKFVLAGNFTIERTDLVAMVEAANGKVLPTIGDIADGRREQNIAAIVIGRHNLNDASQEAVERTLEILEETYPGASVWTEEDLILELIPQFSTLLADQGSDPF